MTELILALDLTSGDEAVDLATRCTPYLDALKVGYPLVLRAGLDISNRLSGTGLPLIADFKVADIPETNRSIAGAVFSAGYSGIICHGFTGADAIRACTETAHDHGGECYVVAEMSHPGALEFFHEGTGERIARTAVGCGADGIIAPATRPERIRVYREIVGRRKILSPGIGAQGGSLQETAGLADGIIVGRSIYAAPDPVGAAKQYSVVRR
ncbi:MAG: orotidine-5'-phosphate decarboxylase [Methanoregulaceae archaeon]|nr:orotidine-5'-phosphate decarboxylase [Methanoregulaceae archaeon]